SAYNVPNASDDLPEPETPTSASRGISTLVFLRLSRARGARGRIARCHSWSQLRTVSRSVPHRVVRREAPHSIWSRRPRCPIDWTFPLVRYTAAHGPA